MIIAFQDGHEVHAPSPLSELLQEVTNEGLKEAWDALWRAQRELANSRFAGSRDIPWRGDVALMWNRERWSEALPNFERVDSWALALVFVTPETMLHPRYRRQTVWACEVCGVEWDPRTTAVSYIEPGEHPAHCAAPMVRRQARGKRA